MILIYRYSDSGSFGKGKIASKEQCLVDFAEQFFGDENPLYFVVDHDLPKEHIDLLLRISEPYYSNKDSIQVVKAPCKSSTQSCEATFNLVKTLPLDEYVYLVEDDYLHKNGSNKVLLEGLKVFEYVTLYDHPDKYWVPSPNHLVSELKQTGHGGEETRVFLTESSHWKLTNSTTMTFACKVRTLVEDYTTIQQFLTGSLPRDFEMFLALRQWRTIASSIPGLSTHADEGYTTPFFT